MAETIRGGATAGSSEHWGYHASWPFASLTVDFDAITLKIFPFVYRIEREHIRFLLEAKVLWFPRLRIVHAKDGFPKVFVFWPTNFSSLSRILARYNYQVQPKNSVPESVVQNVQARYSGAIAGASAAAGLAGFLAAGLGLWAGIRADRVLAPLKQEAREYVAQAVPRGIRKESARLGAFKSLDRVDCDRIYKNFIPSSNSSHAAMRFIEGRTLAHCVARAQFERGPAALDLWLDKSPAGWRIYRCELLR